MLPDLALSPSNLAVRYRASLEPQVLDVSVTLDRAPELAYGPLMLPFLVEAVNLGAAGGAEFPPAAGSARILSGPLGGDPLPDPTRWAWQIGVTGVSPRFLRTILERLASPGPGVAVTSMGIVGSLPLDDSPLSVRESTMLAWLADLDAYPGQWPLPGFPMRDRWIGRGAGIRLRMAVAVDYGLLLQFTRVVEIWNQAIMTVMNGSGDLPGVADVAPRMSRSETELAAGYDAFDFLRAPARAVLVNMLTRFHEQVAPIQHAEIALA